MIADDTQVKTIKPLRDTNAVAVPVGTIGTVQSSFSSPNGLTSYFISAGTKAFIARTHELEVLNGNSHFEG